METPDPWQVDALREIVTRRENVLLCCSRGAGKTQTVAVAAYLEACLGGFVLIVSRSDEQAMTMMQYVAETHARLQLVKHTRLTMHDIKFEDAGRILSRPCKADTLRSKHKVTLLVIDEAALVPDNVFAVATAMTTISKGRIVLLSTPFGRRGFFWEQWDSSDGWFRHHVPWTECPRITPDHIERERSRHGDLWVSQEYECLFHGSGSGLFNPDDFLVDPELEVMSW